MLAGFELKWKGGKRRALKVFLETYAGSRAEFIDSQNYGDFVEI